MRALLFLVALALAAAPAVAQEGNATDATNTTAGGAGAPATATGGDGGAPAAPQDVSFTLVGINQGGDWKWALEGQTRANPPLVVPPGAKVTITIKQVPESEGTPHNIQVGSEPKSGNIAGTGDTQTITFTAPTTPGTLKYVCLIHAGSMFGSVQVRTADAGGAGSGDGEWEKFDGDTVPLGSVASGVDPKCADLPVPAAVAEGVIGAPVASDYVLRCMDPNAGGEPAAPPPHAADYVIPLSWALIGLGVVGVVWVHKFYKP